MTLWPVLNDVNLCFSNRVDYGTWSWHFGGVCAIGWDSLGRQGEGHCISFLCFWKKKEEEVEEEETLFFISVAARKS